MSPPTAVALLVAAGMGTRLGLGVPKALVRLNPKDILSSLLSVCCEQFACTELFSKFFIAAPPGSEDDFFECVSVYESVSVYRGGDTRQQSVRLGCETILGQGFKGDTLVAVHDVARCLVSTKLISDALSSASIHEAVTPSVAVADSIVKTNSEQMLGDPVPREFLSYVQTPQVFTLELLSKAHSKASEEHISATDDAQLVRRIHPVMTIPGESSNFKITTSSDLELARKIWRGEHAK